MNLVITNKATVEDDQYPYRLAFVDNHLPQFNRDRPFYGNGEDYFFMVKWVEANCREVVVIGSVNTVMFQSEEDYLLALMAFPIS